MRIGSLCSGYGGLDMGAQAVVGGEVAWHVEYDNAPSKILAHHWPEVPNYGDLTTLDWSTLPPIDMLTAGYPCQPFSIAGKRKGADDERHLWPYITDAIRVLRPRLVFLENVRGHLTLGFGRVLGDLAEVGYDTRWVCLPASDAGAPHTRERVFILAYPEGEPWSVRNGDDVQARGRQVGRWANAGGGTAAHPTCIRRERTRSVGDRWTGPSHDSPPEPAADWREYEPAIRRWENVIGRLAPAPTNPDGRHGGHRLSARFVEWMMGLPDGHVTDPQIGLTRAQQLKALGNGVVPQQASLALRMLLEGESL